MSGAQEVCVIKNRSTFVQEEEPPQDTQDIKNCQHNEVTSCANDHVNDANLEKRNKTK